MNLPKQPMLVGSLVALAVIVINVVTYQWMTDKHTRAAAGAADLTACRALAAQIQSLRHRPSLAGSHEMQLTEPYCCITIAGWRGA